MRRKIFLVLTLCQMLIIFLLSNQIGEISGEISENFANTMSIEQVNEYTAVSTQPLFGGFSLRKYAHIFLYALLGVFVFFFMKESKKFYIRPVVSILICYVYAVIDEVHQYFVPGREAQFNDTLIDAIGFIGVILICWIVTLLIKRKKLG